MLINMKMNLNLAELTGAMIGDGCLTIARWKDRKSKRLALLTGHLQHDIEYCENRIRPII
jgi:hypothetical protein